MTDANVSKWNARYAYSGSSVPAPSDVLSQGARWLPEAATQVGVDVGASANEGPTTSATYTKRALDLACGRAGNGQFLAARGFQVSAWDISDNVVEEILARKPSLLHEVLVRDVSAEPPEADSFDIIVVTRFLDRALCPAIVQALKPRGLLFYQTFVHGLSNRDYLLEPNELLSLFADLHILEYHHPVIDRDGRAEAKLVARR